MAELKTKQTSADVNEFILSFADTEQKRKDSFELVNLMKELTGFEPKMGKACIYIKKLSDINQDALKKLMNETIGFLQSRYK